MRPLKRCSLWHTASQHLPTGSALERLRERRATLERLDPPVEYRFTFDDYWSRKLFTALLHRYGLQPYRYYRQRYTTIVVKVTKAFVDEILWPEYQELHKELIAQLDEVAEELIGNTIFGDTAEMKEIPGLPLES